MKIDKNYKGLKDLGYAYEIDFINCIEDLFIDLDKRLIVKNDLYCKGDLDCKGNLYCGSFMYLSTKCRYNIGIKEQLIKVGCESKSLNDWLAWLNTDEEYETPRGTTNFKLIHASIMSAIAYHDVYFGG